MAAPIPTVFIPALLCDQALYSDVIDGLDGLIEAHVMMSPKPDLAASAKDILARAPSRFALVGTSYGGNLAVEIARRAPERVGALWLMGCDPAPVQPGSDDPAASLADNLERDFDATVDALAGQIAHPDCAKAAEAFRTMAARVGRDAGIAEARALATRADERPDLPLLRMPALVLWGADDAIEPIDIGRKLAKSLAHAEFHELDTCGHLPTIERSGAVIRIAREFLEAELIHEKP